MTTSRSVPVSCFKIAPTSSRLSTTGNRSGVRARTTGGTADLDRQHLFVEKLGRHVAGSSEFRANEVFAPLARSTRRSVSRAGGRVEVFATEDSLAAIIYFDHRRRVT